MRRKLFFALFFIIFFCNNSYSEKHNIVEVELERIKKDIIDLQKFVYKNNNDFENQTTAPSDIEEINQLLSSISEKLISLENQMKDMKEDISNLYQLYTSPKFQKNITLENSDKLNIEESSSSIVSEKSNDDQILGQMTLTNLEDESLNDKIDINEEVVKDDEDQVLDELSVESLEDQKILIREPSEEQVATIVELENLMEQKEKELTRLAIDIEAQMQIAKQSLASLDNQKAIESLLLILDSKTSQEEMLAETYYLLGRTYFIEGNIIESVKYFGLRHRDLSDVSKFRSENYFWLGKSLFGIGDQENGCLIMEDLIFSDSYLDNNEIIDSAKSLQLERDCGLIID
tara:strand:- start:247 stop:1284 length:1038 start_codon:yes stop_codon:yes gene_type:complete